MRFAKCLLALFLLFFMITSCSQTDDVIVYPHEVGLLRPSDSILLKPNLKVLDIGNSYTNDATAYLPDLVKKLGVDDNNFCLFSATFGGASFKKWYQVYQDISTATYQIKKVVGDLNDNVEVGVGPSFDGSLFRKLLSQETWDLIIIHPLSIYATNYEGWWGHSDSGYLKELLEIIKYHQPNCTIGFLLIHSPADDYSTNEEKSSIVRWEHIANAAQLFAQENDIILIPYGTAIQNLRATGFNNDAELTRDGTHLGLGLARYTAACCYYEALLAPRTGVSILGKDIPYKVDENPERSQYSVTSANMVTAQKAAVLACKDPFHCINPNDYEIEEIIPY